MSQAVRVLGTGGDVPVLIVGTLSAEADGAYTIDCDQGVGGLATGASVVLAFHDDGGRVAGTIDTMSSNDDGGVQIQVIRSAAPNKEQRDFPRLFAGLPIRYRLDNGEADAWLGGGAVDGDWLTPDPYMNFSVGGLRFDGREDLAEGEHLLIDLRIGEGSEKWRCTARVVRVFDQTVDSPPGTRSVAVVFETLPQSAHEALSALTLKIQDSLL